MVSLKESFVVHPPANERRKQAVPSEVNTSILPSSCSKGGTSGDSVILLGKGTTRLAAFRTFAELNNLPLAADSLYIIPEILNIKTDPSLRTRGVSYAVKLEQNFQRWEPDRTVAKAALVKVEGLAIEITQPF